MSPRQREVSCALHPSSKKHTWLVGALVFVGYFAGGVLGRQLASVAEAVTLVWPPTGVAIAALVVYGRGMTLPVWLGALTVNLWSGTDMPGSCLIATGNALEALESEGHRVIAAEDGACALERFEQERESVDVLLFDVRMPRMTGPVAMRAIRAQRRDIPAVLMSGYPGDELAVGEGALASVRLLEKPFELAELTRALDHATRGHVRMAGAPT